MSANITVKTKKGSKTFTIYGSSDAEEVAAYLRGLVYEHDLNKLIKPQAK